MPEQHAIIWHLTHFKVNYGSISFSGYVAALRDARQFTGRDPATGAKIVQHPFSHTGNWLGNIGYLLLLDQIGTCFKPRGVAPIAGKHSTIFLALKYFTNLSDDHARAIYALRCAFAHDYSLININTKPGMTHNFQVYKSPNPPIVTLPAAVWDGILTNRNANNITQINLEALADEIEKICPDLLQLAQANNLEILLPGGSDELLQRYSLAAF
jgi:hypothetical protein